MTPSSSCWSVKWHAVDVLGPGEQLRLGEQRRGHRERVAVEVDRHTCDLLQVTDGDGPVSRLVAKPVPRRLLRHPWADMRRMEDVVRDSGLDWTIIRPPMLTNGPRTGSCRTSADGNVRGGIRLSRADLADGILRCLADPGSVHTAVSIAG